MLSKDKAYAELLGLIPLTEKQSMENVSCFSTPLLQELNIWESWQVFVHLCICLENCNLCVCIYDAHVW